MKTGIRAERRYPFQGFQVSRAGICVSRLGAQARLTKTASLVMYGPVLAVFSEWPEKAAAAPDGNPAAGNFLSGS